MDYLVSLTHIYTNQSIDEQEEKSTRLKLGGNVAKTRFSSRVVKFTDNLLCHFTYPRCNRSFRVTTPITICPNAGSSAASIFS